MVLPSSDRNAELLLVKRGRHAGFVLEPVGKIEFVLETGKLCDCGDFAVCVFEIFAGETVALVLNVLIGGGLPVSLKDADGLGTGAGDQFSKFIKGDFPAPVQIQKFLQFQLF